MEKNQSLLELRELLVSTVTYKHGYFLNSKVEHRSNHQFDYNMNQDFTKGDRIILNGHMKVYQFEDDTGKQRNRVSVAAHRMFKLENLQENESSSSSSDSSDDEKDLDDVNQDQFSGNLLSNVHETEKVVLLNIAPHYNQV